MIKFKTYNDDPNFSIVMPGGCNAACPFCFNKDKASIKGVNKFDWLLNLQTWLQEMPSQFYQISITGNEPMLSPIIDGVLTLCRRMKDRYSNILLTTNGTNLLDKIDEVCAGVHHINISRHHYDEKENKKIFGGTYNVTDSQLELIIDRFSARGVDVSLNCVINDSTSFEFISEFIKFAKRMGANAVRFRKENGDSLEMTPAEALFDSAYPVLSRGECPVCRTWKRVIGGLDTYWKAAVIEPTDKVSDVVYELVYDADGGLYLDWDRKVPFEEFCKAKKEVKPLKPRRKSAPKVEPFGDYDYFDHCGVVSSGCGMGSRSCGGFSTYDSYSSCGSLPTTHC